MEERLLVFVSSNIKEFTAERFVVKEAIESIPLTQPWVFEYTTASSDPLVESYLGKVRKCDLFILLLSQSLTEPVLKEWQIALTNDKPRLVFLKKGWRNPTVETFIKTIDVKWAEFANSNELKMLVQHAVTDELIKGYRRYSLNNQDMELLSEFIELLREKGTVHIRVDMISGDQTKTSHETHFHGQVTGPVHTGSGDINIDRILSDAVVADKTVGPVRVGVEAVSGDVIVVGPGTSAVVAEIPKQVAFERISDAAKMTFKQLEQIYEQNRQQAANWTRFSLGAAMLGFLILLSGVVAMLFDNTTVGLVTTAASLIPEVAAGLFFRQAREANQRVQENQSKLLETEGIHRAIELTMTIDDEDSRNRLKETIILKALGLRGVGKVLTNHPPSKTDE